MQDPDFSYIATNEALVSCCQQLASGDFVAVDSEFMRTDTYYPIAGLIQLADADCCFLLDPLGIQEWGPLQALFTNRDLVKVLHSCSEDLEVFQHLFGVLPEPVFDTQLAAAFLGQGFGMGFQRLVESSLGLELEKGETRSDWLQRPLSESQLHYAALDACCLVPLYQQQRQQLEQLERLDWLDEESRAIRASWLASHDPQRYYLRFKSAWKLKRHALLALQRLCVWREALAAERNIPRGRVVRDNCLFEIVQKDITESRALLSIRDFGESRVRRYGEQIVAILSEAKAVPLDQCPPRLPGPLSPATRKLLARMRDFLEQYARQQHIAVELLLKKQDLESILRPLDSDGVEASELTLPDTMTSWRRNSIGESLLDRLEKERGAQ